VWGRERTPAVAFLWGGRGVAVGSASRVWVVEPGARGTA